MPKHPSRRSRAAHLSIDRVLDDLSELIDIAADQGKLALKVPKVSSWSVADQIEHLRLADLSIVRAIRGLDADGPRQGSPRFVGRLVLATAFIPRGKGRAPGITSPDHPDLQQLPDRLGVAREEYASLHERLGALADSPATIRHPALGHFTAAQLLAFGVIHHRHHRKIINDICRACELNPK